MTPRGRAMIGVIALLAACVAACADNPTEPDAPLVVAIDEDPAWSPDADSIAFIRARATSEGPAGIYYVGSDGGTPRLIADGDFHELRWNPDGTTLATAYQGNLVTIDVASGARALVLTSILGVNYPDWSPDGTRIVYARAGPVASLPADSSGLHIVDLLSGQDVSMRDTLGAPVLGTQPVWSPEDSLIAFNRDGKIEVWNTRTHAISRVLTSPAGFSASNPQWIDGGRRILASEGGSFFRTIVIDIETLQPTGWPIHLGGLRAISPLDTAFVFRDLDTTIAEPPTYVLYRRGLMDVAGTTIHQLTHYLP